MSAAGPPGTGAAGHLVLVTGGARGIGFAIAERFAGVASRVIITGRDQDSLDRAADELGERAQSYVCDVTNEKQVVELFDRVGAVDVLVNNAGMSDSASLESTELADWRRQLDVNATGAFLCTRAALPAMRARGTGRVITVASTAGRVGFRYTSAYSASKHAAVGLMRAVAAELAGTGVTANAVCPAFVRSEMTERSVERIVRKTGRGADEALAALVRSSPLGRLLEPSEVAAAVEFLASDEAGAINGQALVLDGGGIQA